MRSALPPLLLAACATPPAVPVTAPLAALVAPCTRGAWEAPFDHAGARFNAIHAALIPVGPQRGNVLVWEFGVEGSRGFLRWAIVEPEARRVVYEAKEPNPAGELFCSGHAWTNDGRLFVAGGWNFAVTEIGSRECYLFDPDLPGFPFGKWIRQPRLLRGRYYPSVLALGDAQDSMLVLGGGRSGAAFAVDDWDDYEVFVPGPKGEQSQGQFAISPSGEATFAGPNVQSTISVRRFFQYPRVFVLGDAQLAMVGMTTLATRGPHPSVDPGAWIDLGAQPLLRYYGMAVRSPNFTDAHADTLIALGGLDPIGSPPFVAIKTVTRTNAIATGPGAWPNGWSWSDMPALAHARGCSNVVLLPSGDLVVIGGQSGHPLGSALTFSRTPELFDGTSWRELAQETSRRGYHATALLLPSGKVLSAGSNDRDFDYQVLAPPSLCDPRPDWNAPFPPESIAYGASYVIGASGAAVQRVVLMRPASLTHHWDPEQRCVRLTTIVDAATAIVQFTAPSARSDAPPGWWMLFLVSATGTPSFARWVRLGPA